MSTFANKHNAKPNPFTFKTPTGHPYTKPSELVGVNGLDETYVVRALYINKGGKFGDEPVIVTDEFTMNAPHSMVDKVAAIIDDGESTQLINSGEVAFKLYEYTNKYGKQYGVTWVDV